MSRAGLLARAPPVLLCLHYESVCITSVWGALTGWTPASCSPCRPGQLVTSRR